MTQQKLKLIVSAITVCIITVIFVMAIILVVQFVKLGRLRAQANELNSAISTLKDQNESLENQIDFYGNIEAVEDMYRSQGYGKDSDIKFE